MRVSKETAILLKEAGYITVFVKYTGDTFDDDTCYIPPLHESAYIPTLHQAADWLRSKGVHVWTMQNKDNKWFWMLESVPRTSGITDIADGIFDTYESAYEAGIVHGLKYVK